MTPAIPPRDDTGTGLGGACPGCGDPVALSDLDLGRDLGREAPR